MFDYNLNANLSIMSYVNHYNFQLNMDTLSNNEVNLATLPADIVRMIISMDEADDKYKMRLVSGMLFLL